MCVGGGCEEIEGGGVANYWTERSIRSSVSDAPDYISSNNFCYSRDTDGRKMKFW